MDLLPRLEVVEVVPLFVQEVESDLGRQIDLHSRDVAADHAGLDLPERRAGGRLRRADRPVSSTGRALHERRGGLGRLDPLPGDLHQAELADARHVVARLVARHRLGEGALDLPDVLGRLHVDEVDDHEAADVPEA